MKTLLFTLLIIVALPACDDNRMDTTDSKVILTRSTTTFQDVVNGSLGSDPFDISGVSIDGDSVFVTVTYSGGCSFHSFNVIWNESYAESYPPQTSVVIVHDGNDDSCKALITETFSFSLGELAGPIDYESVNVSVINGSLPEAAPSTVAWYPSDIDVYSVIIPQGDECQVEVTASTVICGAGLWNNMWFALNDSVSAGIEDTYFKKWLQPVVISDDLKNFKPVPGKKYMVGARVQNAHPYNDAVVCLAYSGPSVPVIITCVKELK